MESKDRLWLPNFSELMDRLSIHQLKEVFLSEHKDKYRDDMEDIVHDLNLIIEESDKIVISGEMIRAIIVIAQINTHIWYNESKVRSGEEQDFSLLKLTHGLNGIRNRAGNFILELIDETKKRDYKIDCLASDDCQWDIQFKHRNS